jgi:putative heme-binding domain-containing protein
MYREIIESPEYMPEPVREQLDFYSGTERGRIYRIYGVRPSPPRKWPGEAATPELVQSLDDPNQWVRLTSQRLLVERRDSSAIPLLRDLVGTTGMLHALYVLESLEALDERLLRDALRDPSGGVREHALRLAERYASLTDEIIRLVDDPDPRVRLQAVLNLGSFSTSEAVSALARATESGDIWFETAVLTASPELHMRIYQRLVGRDDSIGTGLLREMATVIGTRGDADEIAWVLGHPGRNQRRAVLNGLADGFELAGIRRLEYPKGTLDIAALREDDPGASERGYLIWDWSEPAAEAVDSKLPIEQRRLAARRLASALFDDARAPMERLLSGEMEEQMIALETLSAFPRRDVAEIILSNWPHLKARETALRVLSSRQPWLKRLQEAIADGTILARELTPQARLILLENPDPSIRPTARLTARSIVNRDSVLARIGNPETGRAVFHAQCAVCHLGWNALGPDLAGVNNKSRGQLFEAILTPSRAIPGTYESYVAVLDDESIVAGRIVAESPGTLRFRGYEGITTVLRTRIRAIRQSETSMMPDDTASDLSVQELVDLISFLRAVPE